jgi:hypothetical protein
MSGYTPRTEVTTPQAQPRACGLTRRELRNLRAITGMRKPHKLRAWLLNQTKLAKYGEPGTKRLAAAYAPAVQRAEELAVPTPKPFMLSYRADPLYGYATSAWS